MLFLHPRLRTGLPASRRGDWLTLESPSCSRLQGASPETPSEMRSPVLLCKTLLSGTKDGSAARMCPGLVCCLVWPMVPQWDWSPTKDTASGSARKTPLSLQRGMRNGIKVCWTASIYPCVQHRAHKIHSERKTGPTVLCCAVLHSPCTPAFLSHWPGIR